MSEPADSFLRVLALYEKLGVLESAELWQQSRIARNMAAHDYETDYSAIAEHFNALNQLSDMLYRTSRALLVCMQDQLGITPESDTFADEFASLPAR